MTTVSSNREEANWQSFPWPSAHDNLFEAEPTNRWATADLADHFGSRAYVIATGYREGAEILVQHVLSTGIHQDFLVYPILLCTASTSSYASRRSRLMRHVYWIATR